MVVQSQFIELMQVGYTQKSLCSMCRPRQWPTIQTKDFTNDGYLVYGANGIIGRYREYNHEDRTILMACRGASCGAINISEPKSYITGNAMCLDELSDEINFDFLAYFLSCYDYSQIITGGAQPQITYTNLTKVLVPVPDLTDQDSFVIVLQQADKSKFDGLKSQFIEMFSCALQRKLSDVANITMGASPDSNYYNTTNSGLPFYQGKTEFGDMYIGKATLYCSEPIRIAQPNDILMSVRAPVGTVNITKEECCIGRGLASIRPNGVEQLFLYYALKLKEKDLDALGTGTTFKAINKDMLYEFSIEVGTIDKQKAFVEIAQQADKSKYLS